MAWNGQCFRPPTPTPTNHHPARNSIASIPNTNKPPLTHILCYDCKVAGEKREHHRLGLSPCRPGLKRRQRVQIVHPSVAQGRSAGREQPGRSQELSRYRCIMLGEAGVVLQGHSNQGLGLTQYIDLYCFTMY